MSEYQPARSTTDNIVHPWRRWSVDPQDGVTQCFRPTAQKDNAFLLEPGAAITCVQCLALEFQRGQIDTDIRRIIEDNSVKELQAFEDARLLATLEKGT